MPRMQHFVVAVAIAMTCALPAPSFAAPSPCIGDCDGSRECSVTVNVDCKRYFACDVWVDRDVIVILGENRAQDVRWSLVGEPNAEFTADGISFRNSAFDCRPEGKQAFVCRDAHPAFGVFRYTVNVTVKQSPFGPRGVQSLDRWVVNR